MKFLRCLMVVLLPLFLFTGCNTSPTSRTEALVPSSQEVVRGEARIRAKGRTDLAGEYYAQKLYSDALQAVQKALKYDKSYAPAHNILALIYMDLKEDKSAEEEFQRALKLAPGDPEIANNYGYFLCQTKREADSFQYFSIALKNPLYPTPQIALANAAECSMQIQDYKATEGYLARALALNPNSLRVLMTGANLKYQQKQYPEARYYLSEVHKNAEPDAASASLALRIARHTGNREDEARYLSLLRKKFPDSKEYKKLTQGIVE